MKKFKVSKNLLVEEIDDSLVLLDVEGGNFFELKKTGLEIWKLIEKGKTKKELIQDLKDKYGSNDIENDINEFLEEMLKKEFIYIDK